jgi:1-acyl-sn-glycerol-3-phosphate acyltransferase
VWDAHATIYHGYEICGLEHLPKDSNGLVIYYHGAIPIDMYYFVAKVYLKYDRLIYTVGDRFLFKLPGWNIIAQALKVSPGTVKSCTETLNNGNLLAISPGGVYEAQFGNNCYELLWQQRLGFAKVALESKAPVIPMFTENLREGFRNIGLGRSFFIKLYNWTRIPFRPIYGGFPVKFRTHLGPPIYFEEGTTPKEVQEKTAAAIEKLIVENQRIPGSIVGGLLDRFFEKRQIDTVVNSARQKKFKLSNNKDS